TCEQFQLFGHERSSLLASSLVILREKNPPRKEDRCRRRSAAVPKAGPGKQKGSFGQMSLFARLFVLFPPNRSLHARLPFLAQIDQGADVAGGIFRLAVVTAEKDEPV